MGVFRGCVPFGLGEVEDWLVRMARDEGVVLQGLGVRLDDGEPNYSERIYTGGGGGIVDCGCSGYP